MTGWTPEYRADGCSRRTPRPTPGGTRTDVALYHVIAHGLRRHPGARGELVFHALRGPTYALLFLALPDLRLDGAWFVALLLLLGCDLSGLLDLRALLCPRPARLGRGR